MHVDQCGVYLYVQPFEISSDLSCSKLMRRLNPFRAIHVQLIVAAPEDSETALPGSGDLCMLTLNPDEATSIEGWQRQSCTDWGCKKREKPPLLSRLLMELIGWIGVVGLHCLTDCVTS